MIILRHKLFSNSKNNKETEKQKRIRRRTTERVVAIGTGVGAFVGSKIGEAESDKIRAKGSNKINNISKEFQKDANKAEQWASNAMKHAKNPKEILDYAANAINKRGAQARKNIDRVSKVMNKSANKAFYKKLGKGAVIGTAVATPFAMAANKKMKKNNENLNAKKRGVKE